MLQRILSLSPAPLLGPSFPPASFSALDLSEGGAGCREGLILTYEGLDAYIHRTLQKAGARVGWGGYLERRCFYRQSPHFKNTGEDRCVHLGLDLWAPAGTPLYAPLHGQVHSFAYNDAYLDYGATIILMHEPDEGMPFYSLYGHLSLDSIRRLRKGQSFEAGEPFASIGNRTENGGWVPHLHLQLITDLQGRAGDFPGVVKPDDVPFFQQICPDPAPLIGLDFVS